MRMGLTVKIGVKVVEFVQRFMSNAVYVKIEGENVNDANKETLEELEAQVSADGFLKATGYVRFVYNLSLIHIYWKDVPGLLKS